MFYKNIFNQSLHEPRTAELPIDVRRLLLTWVQPHLDRLEHPLFSIFFINSGSIHHVCQTPK